MDNTEKLYRLESDSIGEKNVPVDAYYGVQTLRAFENFKITGIKTHVDMIIALAQVKKACAIANAKVGEMDQKKADAIEKACDDIIAGKYHDQFITDAIQGGAGTSLNMNANEVIANIAIEYLGGTKGDYSIVSPLNDVNYGQSTNDVIPTAGKLAVRKLLNDVIAELRGLYDSLLKKSEEFDSVIKMGRTQLQDAVPIRLGQEFHSYSCVVSRNIKRLEKVEDEILSVNLGGTAVGTGINANIDYYNQVVPTLQKITGVPVYQSPDMIDSTQNLDGFSAVSSALKTCVVSLSKIANDLRLMSSGPRAGFGEINLPAMQNGSSIMPGKVNPVIPEVVNQVAFLVVGNDFSVSMGVEAAQLELNAFGPLILKSIFESLDAIKGAVSTLKVNCIDGITANVEACKEMVDNNVGLITALTPHVGYERAAVVAKRAIATGASVKELAIEAGLCTPEELEKIFDPKAMTSPGIH